MVDRDRDHDCPWRWGGCAACRAIRQRSLRAHRVPASARRGHARLRGGLHASPRIPPSGQGRVDLVRLEHLGRRSAALVRLRDLRPLGGEPRQAGAAGRGRARQRRQRHTARAVHRQWSLRVSAIALARQRNADAAPADGADDDRIEVRYRPRVRSRARREPDRVAERDALVPDGDWRRRAALRAPASATEPGIDSRERERTGAARNRRRSDREDDCRDPQPAADDELWAPEMNETADHYTARILGSVDGKDPLAVLAATPAALERLIANVAPERLRARPANDTWSVSEIVAHLADGEIVGAFRLRFILGSPGAPIGAYDQDAWVTSGHYDRRDPRKSVEQFRVVREANLALLASLDPPQWQHHGVHSERGPETIERVVRMFAGHDLNHLRQIEKILT